MTSAAAALSPASSCPAVVLLLATVVHSLPLPRAIAVQKSPHVQHCIRFLGSFASKTPGDCEVATAVLEGLLEHLCHASAAADKDVRLHACQLLTQLLAQLPASVLSDDTVLDSVAEALTERLGDKLPAVRADAVRGLCSLIAFFEVGCLSPIMH